MVAMLECPLCKTRVAILDGTACPACGRDVTDQDAIAREERIDHIYNLLWQHYQDGRSLQAALDEVRNDESLKQEDIDAAGASFAQEGQRKLLNPGKRNISIGLVSLVVGVAATVTSFLIPVPIVIVFYGAIAFGLVEVAFGIYEVLKYQRYFRL